MNEICQPVKTALLSIYMENWKFGVENQTVRAILSGKRQKTFFDSF